MVAFQESLQLSKKGEGGRYGSEKGTANKDPKRTQETKSYDY